MLNGNFHNVRGINGTNDAGPCKGTLAVFDTGGLEIRHNGEILPYLAL